MNIKIIGFVFIQLIYFKLFAQKVPLLENAPLDKHIPQLIDKNVKHYQFSADGRRIVYIANDQDLTSSSGELFAVNSDGTNQVKIADNASSIFITDLEQLIYGSNQGAFKVNFDGTDKIKVSPDECPQCTPYAISLNSKLILMKHYQEVFIVDFEGNLITRVPQVGANNGGYVFFEEENAVVYWSEGKIRMFNYETKSLNDQVEKLEKWYEPIVVNGQLYAYFEMKLFKINYKSGKAYCLSCKDDLSIRSKLIIGKNGICMATIDGKRVFYDILSDQFNEVDFLSNNEKDNPFVEMNEAGNQLLNAGYTSVDLSRKNRNYTLYLFDTEADVNQPIARTTEAYTMVPKHLNDRYKIIHIHDVEQQQMNFYLYDYWKDSIYRLTDPILGWSNFYLSPKKQQILFRKQHAVDAPHNSFKADLYVINLDDIEKDSTQNVGFVENKQIDIQHKVRVQSKEITLKFWDGQKVDGDRISVKLNKEWLFQDVELKKLPKTLTVQLPKKGEYNLFMIALNEGSIPPNTASVLIKDGQHKRQISLSSDLHNAGTIKIIRVK